MTEELQKLLDVCTKKQRSFVLAITEVGGKGYNNCFKAAKIAGAEGNDNTVRQTAHKWVINGKVVAAVSCIEAERELKSEHTYEIAVQELNQLIGWLKAKAETGNVQAIRAYLAAITEKDAITGLHKTEVKQTGQGLSITISERQTYPRKAGTA